MPQVSGTASSSSEKVGEVLLGVLQQFVLHRGRRATSKPADPIEILKEAADGRGELGERLSPDEKSKINAAAAEIDDNVWHLDNRKRLLKAALLGQAMAVALRPESERGDDDSANDPIRESARQAIDQIARAEPAPDPALGAMLLFPGDEYRQIEQKFDGDKHMIAAHFKVPVEAVLTWQKWADQPVGQGT